MGKLFHGNQFTLAPQSTHNNVAPSLPMLKQSPANLFTIKYSNKRNLVKILEELNPVKPLPLSCSLVKLGVKPEVKKMIRHRVVRMVEGLISNPWEYPWNALLVHYNSEGKGEYVCSVNAISERWLVTTAECVYQQHLMPREPEEFGVVFMVRNEEVEIEVEKVCHNKIDEVDNF